MGEGKSHTFHVRKAKPRGEVKQRERVSSDPFENPALAALREPDEIRDSLMAASSTNMVLFCGDWNAVGSSAEGVKKFSEAVAACYRANGIECMTENTSDLQDDVDSKTGSASFWKEGAKGKTFVAGIMVDNYEADEQQINQVTEEIIDAAQRLQTAHAQGVAKKGKK